MVREAEKRQRKFEAKVDAEVLRQQTTRLKPLMVKAQRDYFPQIVSLEQRIKKLVEAKGVSTLLVRDYLNFGREMLDLSKRFIGTTLQAEAQLKTDKWRSRGLDGTTLIEVAQLVGVTPSTLPTPPTILNLDDLQDVEITSPSDKEVLTYESITKLWKNKPTSIPIVPHPITLFGDNLIADYSETTLYLGYDLLNDVSINVEIQVPTGKTFYLYAMGVIYSTNAPEVMLRTRNATNNVVLHQTARGSVFESYYDAPYTATGECLIFLEGVNTTAEFMHICGFIVFEIK